MGLGLIVESQKIMSAAKAWLKKIVPAPVFEAYKRRKRRRMDRINASMSTEEVFTRIYREGEWGGSSASGEEPCSGEGSMAKTIVDPYVERIKAVLDALGLTSKTVVDLGCGDFRVGQRLTSLAGNYVGVDIVEDLIKSHREQFGSESVSFEHRNLITDELPPGEVCFVRQVLQHLSNEQVKEILPKLQKYPFSIITEHYPRKDQFVEPNVDKVQGQGVRLYAGSGVYLDEAPFGIETGRMFPILEVPSVGFVDLPDPGVIRTYVLVPAEQAAPVRERLEAAGLLLGGMS